MSDEPKEPKSSKGKKKADPAPKKDAETTPEPTPAETPVESPGEPVPVDPAPDTSQPGSVLEELSNRAEEPAAESRNELVFDPSSGELVVKAKGESVGSDAVIVSDIADEGFFAEDR
jgi:hypothetical protein